MGRTSYRKTDLEKLTSPEQLDQLLTITTPKAWLALIAAAVIVVAAAVWGFAGQVAQTVPGQCILVRSGGVRQIVFPHSGQVTDIRPQPGDFVRRGDVVARLSHPQLVNQILEIQAQVDAIKEAATRDDAAATGSAPTRPIATDESDLVTLTARLESLREQLENVSRVVSPYDGRVLQVRTDVFEFVPQGATLLTLELSGDQIKDLEAVVYLPVDSGRSVATGMMVEIVPTPLRKEEYGYMTGRVVSVSEFPVTTDEIRRVVGNEQLVALFSQGAPQIEVRADLLIDPDTVTGFKWSSSLGPPIKLAPGTLCQAAVLVGHRSPISLLFGGNR